MEMIKVDNVGIKFKMSKRRRRRTRDFLVDRVKNLSKPSGEFWALRNVSFSVNKGDTIGIIGRNGSGKSTLLRAISGIYLPDEGSVSVNGEITTLFSLGLGFQPELSGRDNIYLNGVMMGLSRKDIDSIVDKIIDFTELGEFIEMPVRTYSSGMHSRLGFAIAINVDKDIVLIDEIMGVGDAAFREKAEKEMSRIIGEKTIVMVSHSMHTISRFANKAIWLEKGKIVKQGEAAEVTTKYLESSVKKPITDAMKDDE